jgi:hypothetical protein
MAPKNPQLASARMKAARHAGVILVTGALALRTTTCNLPTECDCGPTGAAITIPASRSKDVAGLAVTGPCTLNYDENEASSEGLVHLEASADGTCRVDVTFRGGQGPFSANIDFGYIEGDCCRGYYAKHDRSLAVPSAGTGIVVPGEDAGVTWEDGGSRCVTRCGATVKAVSGVHIADDGP